MAMIGTDVGAGAPVSTSHGSGKVTSHGASGSRAGQRSAPGAFDALMSTLSESEFQEVSADSDGISERRPEGDSAGHNASLASGHGLHWPGGGSGAFHGRHERADRSGRGIGVAPAQSAGETESQTTTDESGIRGHRQPQMRSNEENLGASSSASSLAGDEATGPIDVLWSRPFVPSVASQAVEDETVDGDREADSENDGGAGGQGAAVGTNSSPGQSVVAAQRQLAVVPTVATLTSELRTLSDAIARDFGESDEDGVEVGTESTLPRFVAAHTGAVEQPRWLASSSSQDGVQPGASVTTGGEAGNARSAVLLELRRALAALDREQSGSSSDASTERLTAVDAGAAQRDFISEDVAAVAKAGRFRHEQRATTSAIGKVVRLGADAAAEESSVATTPHAEPVAASRQLFEASVESVQGSGTTQDLDATGSIESYESDEPSAFEPASAEPPASHLAPQTAAGETAGGVLWRTSRPVSQSQLASTADVNSADVNSARVNRADVNRADVNRADVNRADVNRTVKLPIEPATSTLDASLRPNVPDAAVRPSAVAELDSIAQSETPASSASGPQLAAVRLAGAPPRAWGRTVHVADVASSGSTQNVDSPALTDHPQNKPSATIDPPAVQAVGQSQPSPLRVPFEPSRARVDGRHVALSRSAQRQDATGIDARVQSAVWSAPTSTQPGTAVLEDAPAEDVVEASTSVARNMGSAAQTSGDSPKTADANRSLPANDLPFAPNSSGSEAGTSSGRPAHSGVAPFVTSEKARPSAHNARAIAAFQAASLASITTFGSSHEATAVPRGTFDAALDAHVTGQLVHAVRVQTEQGGGQARITLNPTFLGDVSIDVRTDGTSVVASIHASNAELREWMRTNENALRQSLAEQGLSLDQFVIADDEAENGQSSGERDPRHQEERQQQWQRRNRQTPEHSTFEVVL